MNLDFCQSATPSISIPLVQIAMPAMPMAPSGERDPPVITASAAAAVSKTHSPCRVHAIRKRTGLPLMSSKRLSLPAFSMRLNRKVASLSDQIMTIAATSVARRSRSPDRSTAATVTLT